MHRVTQLAIVDADICNGCGICPRLCPVLAIDMVDRKAVINDPICTGCNGCEQRCPVHAIRMVHREDPFLIEFPWTPEEQPAIDDLCRKANFNPEQIICYCTETRAQEVAASVLAGNDTPEKVSATSGIRLGCKIECIQPILRILDAAGIKPVPPKGGIQWYGLTPTVFDIPDHVKAEYARRGFDFDGDIELMEEIRDANK